MKILDRYIKQTVILSTIFVSLVLASIQIFLSLVEEIKEVGVGQYSVWKAFLYVPMELPDLFYQLFPMAGFLGCLIALGRLSTNSELIVMRSSGVSIKRIAFSVMKAVIPMIILMSVIGEWIGPLLQYHASEMRLHALHPKRFAELHSLWIKDHNTFTHIDDVVNNQITGVTQYHFNDQQQLTQAAFANHGQFINRQWQLSHVSTTVFLPNKTAIKHHHLLNTNLKLKPVIQMKMEESAIFYSLKELFKTIQYRRFVGLNAETLTFQFWQRILQPISSMIMICLAVPFVFGSLRNTSMAVKVLIGIVIGFIFYMMNQLFGPITLLYQFPALLAAIMPTLVFFIILIILLTRVQ